MSDEDVRHFDQSCPSCGGDLAREDVYATPALADSAARNLLHIDEDGMRLSAYVQCPRCGDVVGGEVWLDDRRER